MGGGYRGGIIKRNYPEEPIRGTIRRNNKEELSYNNKKVFFFGNEEGGL